MSAHANATPQELLAAVDTAVREFSAGPQRDDIAALALRPARTAG